MSTGVQYVYATVCYAINMQRLWITQSRQKPGHVTNTRVTNVETTAKWNGIENN